MLSPLCLRLFEQDTFSVEHKSRSPVRWRENHLAWGSNRRVQPPALAWRADQVSSNSSSFPLSAPFFVSALNFAGTYTQKASHPPQLLSGSGLLGDGGLVAWVVEEKGPSPNKGCCPTGFFGHRSLGPSFPEEHLLGSALDGGRAGATTSESCCCPDGM